jgi:hypothetical protein
MSLTQRTREHVEELIQEAFPKLRQIDLEKKKLKAKVDAIFEKLLKSGVSKAMYQEGAKRAQQKEAQLNLFDKGAAICEETVRAILAEQVTDKQDKPEPGEKPAKATKTAAKKKPKAAKAKAEPEPKKKIDAVSPPNLPEKKGNVVPIGQKPPAAVAGARKSHRQQVQQPARPPKANPNDSDVAERMQNAGARPGAEGVSLADLPVVSGSGLGGNGFVDHSEHISAEDYNARIRQGSDHQ